MLTKLCMHIACMLLFPAFLLSEVYFFVPPKNWCIKDDGSMSSLVIFQSPESKKNFSPLVAFRVYDCQNEEAFLEQTKKDIEKDRTKKCALLTKHQTQAGMAHILQTEQTGNPRGQITLLQGFVFVDNKMLTLSLTSLTEFLPSLYSDILQSLESLQVLNGDIFSLLKEEEQKKLSSQFDSLLRKAKTCFFNSEEELLAFFKPEFEKVLLSLEKKHGHLGSYFVFLAMQQLKKDLVKEWHDIS